MWLRSGAVRSKSFRTVQKFLRLPQSKMKRSLEAAETKTGTDASQKIKRDYLLWHCEARHFVLLAESGALKPTHYFGASLRWVAGVSIFS
jgi:hypothetical protein